MSAAQSPDPTADALVDAALRIVDAEGVEKLTVRRLAADAGVSTMAVYTRFGSVGAVASAVRERGFAEFAELLESVAPAADPLVGMFGQGLRYLRFAGERPHLYSLMFQYVAPDGAERERRALLQYSSPSTPAAGARAFEAMRGAIAAALGEDDPVAVLVQAGEVWSTVHGIAMLGMAGHLRDAQDLVADALFVTLAVGHGARRDDAVAALAAARELA